MTASDRLRATVLLLAALLLAACRAGAVSAPAATTGPIATDPDAPVGTDLLPGGGGPGLGTGVGELTIPQPGQLDVHPVAADSLEAAVVGRAVTVRITFTSGVAPCYVLDTIVVNRGEMAFAITLREGHAPGANICIEIAMVKHAQVDLGELEPGTYTIRDAMGGAAPIQVVVS
jgi:hypothetical protein